MDIASILFPDCTKSAVRCNSKKKLLEYISSLAAQRLPGMSEQEVFDALLEREKLGSTGLGNGIALPHGKIGNEHNIVAVMVQCESPIEFDAIDKKPVDLLFALLVPVDQCQNHLKTLASVAEKLSDKGVLKRLRCAEGDSELYQALISS